MNCQSGVLTINNITIGTWCIDTMRITIITLFIDYPDEWNVSVKVYCKFYNYRLD